MAVQSNISLDPSLIDCNLAAYPRVQLSLEFQYDYNTDSQRQLCDDLWRLIAEHPELEKIKTKGWSGKKNSAEKTPKEKKISKEKPQLPCDTLNQLKERHSYITKSRKKGWEADKCLLEDKLNSDDSVTQLREDLNEYDSRIVPLQLCPPEI